MSTAVLVLPMVWAAEASRTERKTTKGISPERRRTAPELAFYRKYTEGLLRRYVRLSMEAGRTPSMLGREMFRGRVTHYSVRGFDDVVIFVHDVENCLKVLDETRGQLIRRIGLQEYTQEETAAMLGIALRSVQRWYGDALDALTEVFLERRLLEPSKASQEAGTIL